METSAPPRAIFDHIDGAVRRMGATPCPPAVDGRAIGVDAPLRPIPLEELRALLLDRSTSYATRDRALALVAERARVQADPWLLALTWLLLPGLRRMRDRLIHAGADGCSAEAELVAGVLSALHDREQPAVQGVASCLCWHAYRYARCGLGLNHPPVLSIDAAMSPPAAPPRSVTGGAEAVLNAAVARGVLTEADAELVAATRLEGRGLDELASEMAVRPGTLQRRRARAEARLAALLDGSAWKIVPRGGRLGVRWARALGRSEAERRAALSYRPRPGARLGADSGRVRQPWVGLPREAAA